MSKSAVTKVMIFRQTREHQSPGVPPKLFDEIKRGRLRQGWFVERPNLSLELDDDAWLKNCKGVFKKSPTAVLRSLEPLRTIEPGDLLVVPNQPADGDLTFVLAKAASGKGRFACYRRVKPIGGDFGHCISVSAPSLRVLKAASGRVPDLSKRRYPVRGASAEMADELLHLYVSMQGARANDRASRPETFDSGEFQRRKSGGVVVTIEGGTFDRSRAHEKLVNRLADHLESTDAKLCPNAYPIDLLMLAPTRVAFEVKRAGGNAMHAVRDAVGQLIFYGWKYVKNARSCVVLDEAPTDEVLRFVEDGAHMGLCWFDGQRLVGGKRAHEAIPKFVHQSAPR